MYLPRHFREENETRLLHMMQEYPFATVTTVEDGKPFCSHLPILVSSDPGRKIKLFGHVARSNPQWKHFSHSDPLVVFSGPHTYVTPSWYKNELNVPTWNYAAVHARGPARLIENFHEKEKLIASMVEFFEKNESTPWAFNLPEEFKSNLLEYIVCFEIDVQQLEGKFKLSQNRSKIDREGVLAGLETRNDENSLGVLNLMRSAEPT